MSAAAAAATQGDAGGIRPLRAFRRVAWVAGVVVLLAAMILYQRHLNPSWSEFDVQTLALSAVPLAFAAMAQATIVIGGGVDLSIGSQMALCNVIAARYMVDGGYRHALLLSAALVVLFVLIGALVGAVIGVTGVPDIVVTLAASFIWLGAALYVLGSPGGGAPEEFTNLATLDTFITPWLPLAIVILLVIFAVVWLPIRRSRWGLSIYAIGSDRNAAYLSGISIFRARIFSYALAGVFTACAGLALTSASYGQGDANTGEVGNYTLNSVAAVVLGGVSLAGGIGGLIGPVIGAFILSLVPTILLLLEVDSNWGTVIQGAIVILVVTVGGLALRRRGP